MTRIVTNADTLATRSATAEEIARAAAIQSRTERERSEAKARYVAARARVLAAAPRPWLWHNAVSTNADFEKLVRQAWGADHEERAAHGGKPSHPKTWADYAEKVAEKYAPKLPYYAHQGADPSARG